MRTPRRTALALFAGLPLTVLLASPSLAAGSGKGRNDTTAPVVSISNPSAGTTTASSLTVNGSASDNKSVASVALQLDAGAWQVASGTNAWSVALAGLADGTHTVSARASDPSGNTGTASLSFSVSTPTASPSPSPSPTSSPSPSPSPSPTASATTSPAPSPTATATTSTSAPNTQGTWTSPEGMTITVNTAGAWTIAQVYQLELAASAGPGDFALIAPHLTVQVQDTYASSTVTSASGSPGAYTGFAAVTYLKGVSSTFASQPESQSTHEYGHVWTLYHLYMNRGGDWSTYENTRWVNSDGSIRLAQDSRLNGSYSWDVREIAADDYRLLFGSSLAVSESPNHLNSTILNPRLQPGLRDWFLTNWK